MKVYTYNKVLPVAFLALAVGLGVLSMQAASKVPLLHLTAGRGDIDTVQMLLETNVGRRQLTQFDADYGRMPLHWAAASGHVSVIQLLLEHGADVNAADESGYTPFFLAVRSHHDDVVQLLLKSGANPDIKNASGEASLHASAYHCDESISRLLLEAGADVYAEDEHGDTALKTAVTLGRVPMIRLLVGCYGVDIDAGRNGLTSLRVASEERAALLRQLDEQRMKAIHMWAGSLQEHGLIPDIVNNVILKEMVFTENQHKRFKALGS